jgi:hypothetical protein
MKPAKRVPNDTSYSRDFYNLNLPLEQLTKHNADPHVCVKMDYYNDFGTYGRTVIPTRLSKKRGKDIIGWKKALVRCAETNDRVAFALVKLEIKARTPRQQSKNYKCRAGSATVLAVHHIRDGSKLTKVKSAHYVSSDYDWQFRYVVGAVVRPKKRPVGYDRTPKECAPGIHFFLTKTEALAYSL